MLNGIGDSVGGSRGKRRGGEGGVDDVDDDGGGVLTGDGSNNLYWGAPLLAFAILPLGPAGPHCPLPPHQIESKYLPPSDLSNPRCAGSSLVGVPSVG